MILTYLDSPMAIFDFNHLQAENLSQSWNKNIWANPVSVKIRVLQNALNGIGTTMRTTFSQNFSLI